MKWYKGTKMEFPRLGVPVCNLDGLLLLRWMWHIFFRYVSLFCDIRLNQVKRMLSVWDVVDEQATMCLPPVALPAVPTVCVVPGDAPEKFNFLPYAFQVTVFEGENEVITIAAADIKNRVVRVEAIGQEQDRQAGHFR